MPPLGDHPNQVIIIISHKDLLHEFCSGSSNNKENYKKCNSVCVVVIS